MSRIGKMPIAVPANVDVAFEDDKIKISGPNGSLEQALSSVVDVVLEDGQILVQRRDDTKESRSHHGLMRSLVANMVTGVTTGFTRELEINGVGYRAELMGSFIRFDLGYSHPIFLELPESVTAEVKTTAITLKSPSKEIVGQVASKIRSLRKPEPYKGKGVKYKEEILRRKAGKSGK